MPIKGDFTWSDREDSVLILVPTKGKSANEIDIQVTKRSLKVNYLPFLIDIILYDKIDPSKQKAKKINGILNITLFKLVHKPWISLQSDEIISVDTRKILDAEVISFESEITQKRIDRKIEDERFTLRQQMAIDESERASLDMLKNKAKKEAEESVYTVLDDLNNKSTNKARVTFQSEEIKQGIEEQASHMSNMIVPVRTIKNISNDGIRKDIETVIEDNEEEDRLFHTTATPQIQQHLRSYPRPRSSSTVHIPITFSYREFPTPLRESKVAEEQDWLSKNRKHLKKHAVFAKNMSSRAGNKKGLGVSEEDPVWLKAKGDDFFRHGDLLSAISAYTSSLDSIYEVNEWTSALSTTSTIVNGSSNTTTNTPADALVPPLLMLDQVFLSTLANRANCYFQTGRYVDCITDCQLVFNVVKLHFHAADNDKNNSSSFSCDAEIAIRILVTMSIRLALCHCVCLAYDKSVICYEQTILLLQQLSSDSGGACLNADNCVIVTGSDEVNCFQVGQTDDDQQKYLIELSRLQLHALDSQLKTRISNSFSISSLNRELSVVRVLAQAKHLKSNADQVLAREKDTDKAMCLYNECLSILPYYVSALSNRATCRLSVSDFSGCVEDCSMALSLLGHSSGSHTGLDEDSISGMSVVDATALQKCLSAHVNMSKPCNTASSEPVCSLWTITHQSSASQNEVVAVPIGVSVMYESIVPVQGSERHKVSLIHTLCRRGMALLKLQQPVLALCDYQCALILDPTNKGLVNDCAQIKKSIATAVV